VQQLPQGAEDLAARALARRGAARLAGPEAAFRLFREWASIGLFQARARKQA